VVELSGAQARMTLLDWLRIEDGAMGVKEGCAEGDCGACTVVLRRRKCGRLVHEPVNACVLLAGQADGAEVLTAEDIGGPAGALHPVQDAMVRHHGSQCGFCTPGIVMSLFALYHEGARPVTRTSVCDQLAGNLCRCTGYRPIIDAALEACAGTPPALTPEMAERLDTMDSDTEVFAGDDDAFFAAPRSERELAALRVRHPDALLVSGATDAGLWFTKALLAPRRVIWLGRVQGLDRIEHGADHLAIGATATLADAAHALRALAPDLGEVVRRFGSAQVRASATVGGNIANGSPIGDLAPCLIALGARIELAQGTATRTLPLENFFVAYRQQDRRVDETVRRIVIPLPAANSVFRAYKVSKRMDEDISAVLGAFAVVLQDRRVVSARLAFGGMAGVPARAPRTEQALTGVRLDERADWRGALDTLGTEFSPLTDHRASAEYRRLVARNLLAKALTEMAGVPAAANRITVAVEGNHAAP
jgi:xanthine dehydrogenase small subunit